MPLTWEILSESGDRNAGMHGPMNGFCRDCLGEIESGERCPDCSSPRLVRHLEIDQLAIAHIDCDAFYATIEKRDNPSLAERPVIVGGGRRGVVATACYIARISGVHSAMPMFKALQVCPEAVVISPDMAKYANVGRQIRNMMLELTPLVEPLSIDEAFLDLSGTELIHGLNPARTLASFATRIEDEVGITISVGRSHNKFLAKIASDLDKPRGFQIIGRAETEAFLADQPIGIIWGVGKALQRRLAGDGLKYISDLRNAGEPLLTARYGAIGRRLAALAWGKDARAVTPQRNPKSISAETTFETDIADYGELESRLWNLCEKVSARAKKAGLDGRTVVLKLKTAQFKASTRNARLDVPTQLAGILFGALAPVLRREADGRRFRLLGLGLSDLSPASEEPASDLFAGERVKSAQVEAAMDEVRARFGPGSVDKGRAFSPGRKPRYSQARPKPRAP